MLDNVLILRLKLRGIWLIIEYYQILLNSFLLAKILKMFKCMCLIDIIELMLILVQKLKKKKFIFLFHITNFYICK